MGPVVSQGIQSILQYPLPRNSSQTGTYCHTTWFPKVCYTVARNCFDTQTKSGEVLGPLSWLIHRQSECTHSPPSRRKLPCMLVRYHRSRTSTNNHHKSEEKMGSIWPHQSRMFRPSLSFHLRFRTTGSRACQQNERCIINDP